jgi:hypothetical protein
VHKVGRLAVRKEPLGLIEKVRARRDSQEAHGPDWLTCLTTIERDTCNRVYKIRYPDPANGASFGCDNIGRTRRPAAIGERGREIDQVVPAAM